MADITTRETSGGGATVKGSPLTNAEVDTNFINLQTDKIELTDISVAAEPDPSGDGSLAYNSTTGVFTYTPPADIGGAVTFAAQAGEALSKGDVVYVSGVSGNTPVVSKADADDANKMPAYGLAEDAANLNAAVNVVTFGTLYNLNTSGFSVGDNVYVSTTAGALTNSAPTGESSLIQNIGMVVRSHASAGSIKVGGAGRTNATPNLNDGNVFIGNASNQAVARALTGDDISGGTITSFASTGIDDNASSTKLTVADSAITTGSIDQLIVAHSTDGGGIRIDSTNSTNAGSLRFGDDLDNYIGALEYNHASNAMSMYVNNATRMTITSAGNVGIGTTSPAVKTQIVGSGAIFRISDDVSTSGTIELSASSSEAVIHANTYASAVPLVFKNASTERMRIDSSGNVGIGTSSPSFILGTGLHIDSSGYTSIVLQKGGAGQGHNIDFTDASNALQYRIGTNFASGGENLLFAYGSTPTIGMTLNSSGNVGIGTASPSHSLDVSTGATSRINTTDGTRTFLSGVWASQPRIETSGGTLSVAASGAYDIAFSTNGSERMRVLSSGGLTFNGDTAAANALDDYEEGTWTPTFFDDGAGGTNLTYSQQTGTYTKIGRLVYLKFRITVSAKGGTGSGQGLFIASLPFNIGYFSSTVSTAMFDANQADNITNVSAPEELSAYSFSANPTVLYLLSSGGSVNSNSVQSNTVLEGSIIYHA